MGPGMYTDFVSGHILIDKNSRMFINTRPDNKEGGGEVLLLQVVEQISWISSVGQQTLSGIILTGLER